ncbi:MAG: PAS domain-containing protein [Acidimicrobiales bacterium]
MTGRDDAAWLRAALDAMHDMVLIKDPGSRLQWANRSFLDYYSMSQEQLIDLIDGPQSDPDDTLQYVRDDQHVVRTADHLDVPSEAVTGGDGVARHFHTLKSPIIDDGVVVGTVGVSRSLDQLPPTSPGPNHVEAKSLSRPLRLLIDAFPLAMLLVDPVLQVVADSPRWANHFGSLHASAEHGLASNYPELPGLVELVRRVMQVGGTDRIQLEVGEAVFEIDAGRWHYEDNTVGGVIVTAADVTELIQRQKLLEAANQRHDLMVHGTRLGIWDWADITASEGYWSPNVFHIMGYEDGEIPSTLANLMNATHPDDLPVVAETMKKLQTGADSFEVEHRIRTKSGAYKWILASGAIAEPDENGNRRMVGAMQDIDDRRKVQSELERINVDLDHFVHVAAHDLREPCRRQLMLVDLMLEDHQDELSEPVVGRLRQVQEQSRRMLDLIGAFRTLTNTRGLQTEPTTIVDLQQLVDDVVAEHDPDGSRAPVTVDLPRLLQGHPTLLRVLFTNLIDNAYKYGRGDAIGVRTVIEEGRQVYVVENSLAEPMGVVSDLFKPFVRGGSEVAGSGIGLSICRRAVEAHHGEIWLDDDLTHFRIKFTLGESS